MKMGKTSKQNKPSRGGNDPGRWGRKMKEYVVKVISKETGIIQHITGKWENWQEMEKELEKDGYIVIWFER